MPSFPQPGAFPQDTDMTSVYEDDDDFRRNHAFPDAKILYPKSFAGHMDPFEVKGYIRKMEGYFRFARINDNEMRVALFGAKLTRSAEHWYTSVLDREPNISYTELVQEFQEQFIPAGWRIQMAQNFLHLKQKTMIREYVSEFSEYLGFMTSWPDKALMAAFLCGLKDNRTIRRCIPNSLKDAMAIALSDEGVTKNSYTEKRSRRQNKWHNGHRHSYAEKTNYPIGSFDRDDYKASSALTKDPDAMEVDAMTVRDKEKKCFYCHKKGHIMKDCPELPKKEAGRQ